MPMAGSGESFEGTAVDEFVVKLPSATLDGDYYPEGTKLRLAVDVHLDAIGYERTKDGTFVRVQKMKFDDVVVVAAFDPADAVDGVGGSLAAGAVDEEHGLPIDVGRTGDQWPPTVDPAPSEPSAGEASEGAEEVDEEAPGSEGEDFPF